MKITDLTITLWEWRDIPPTRYTKLYASPDDGITQMALVKISTDEGLEGYSFFGSSLASAKRDAASFIEVLKPMLIGVDPLDREALFQRMSQRVTGSRIATVGAIDVALWDLAGKMSGLPVHQLLGSQRRSVPAYASSAVLAGPQDYADQAVWYKDAGWQAYKIHPHGEPEPDITICEAVRKAVGDDYCIMLDATWGYDYAGAVKVGHCAQELGFYWYEDPLPWDDIDDHVRLKKELDIPIMATELPHMYPRDYAPWITKQATDFLRGDVCLKGGLSSCLKTAHTAETFGMNYEVHHGGNSFNNLANLHLIMAISNCEYFEVLLPAEAQKHGLITDIDVDDEGMVHVPESPGFGAEIDFNLIEKNTIAVLN